MKRMALLIAALAVSFSAQAQQVDHLEARNEGGGKIVLTLRHSDTCTGNLLVAYASHPQTSTLFGCWMISDDLVHIIYSDGEVRTYEPAVFSTAKKR